MEAQGSPAQMVGTETLTLICEHGGQERKQAHCLLESHDLVGILRDPKEDRRGGSHGDKEGMMGVIQKRKTGRGSRMVISGGCGREWHASESRRTCPSLSSGLCGQERAGEAEVTGT